MNKFRWMASLVSLMILTSLSACSWSDDDDDDDDNAPTCGDGEIDGEEECDDGATVSGDGCSSICVAEFCGDGVVNDGEACDDANNRSGDGCEPDCSETPLVCGDGFLADNEACDDGNADDCDGCASDCSREDDLCGDGIPECGEACDGGANCADDCTVNAPFCGDGVIDSGEACDDGEANGSCGSCDEACGRTTGVCGDGIVEVACGEECDGSAVCLADCTLAPCGDGVLGEGEICDLGAQNGLGYGLDTCSATCDGPNEYCGDGAVNGNEPCDDGSAGSDQCAPNCVLLGEASYSILSATQDGSDLTFVWTPHHVGGVPAESYVFIELPDTVLGSSIRHSGLTQRTHTVPNAAIDCSGGRYQVEASNGGLSNLLEVDPCNPGCGDGVVNGTELCDTGEENGNPRFGCTDQCEPISASCGDGVVDADEACDGATGDFPANAECSEACSIVCQDGYEPSGELCVLECPVGFTRIDGECRPLI